MPRMDASTRFWVKVDKSGDCWTWQAARLPKGYGRFGVGGSVVLAHRFAYAEANGPIPEGMHIDHTCFNPSCVRPSHLRAVTPKQNIENRAGLSRNNTSGVRGVSWSRHFGRWKASIKHHGRDIWVGSFTDLAEAEAAVKAKRLELFTHNDVDRASLAREVA